MHRPIFNNSCCPCANCILPNAANNNKNNDNDHRMMVNAQIRIFLTCRYRRDHKIETCVVQCDQIENFYTIWPIGIKKICLMATKK